MPELRSTCSSGLVDRATEEWHDRVAPALRSATGGLSPGWGLAGLAVLALGALAVYHFGPDFRRYIKMERM
jgi:hypothetical protein